MEKIEEEITQEQEILLDSLVKIQAIGRLCMKKGLFTEQELSVAFLEEADLFAKFMTQGKEKADD